MGTQLSIRSVGRPRLSLTTDEYIIRRRTQNKLNKRNQRLREKLLEETNTEPMVKYSNHVHTTTDYYLFKSIDGNRNKNLLHINRLKKSMQLTLILLDMKF